MSKDHEIEIHPWKWFAPANSKTLIVGTFPSARRNWSYEFFYPNKANFFWRMMATIAGTELQHFSGIEAVDERKKILVKLRVAITDMGHTISRHAGSSLDENIAAVEFMDIFQILEENPGIHKIIFTSSRGPTSATRWFIQFLEGKNIRHVFPKGNRPLRSELEINGKSISLVVLYSPSPRAANRITMEKLVELYRDEIKT